ncbi:MAG: hypothetical protein ILO10_05085, partial [Kiritimatiellae bacterium]|nr:hypothetical protein [Kiritimatiellia bacterium]
EFRKFGGVRERMHAARIEARGEEWDKAIFSRLEGAGSAEELERRAGELGEEIARAGRGVRKRRGW